MPGLFRFQYRRSPAVHSILHKSYVVWVPLFRVYVLFLAFLCWLFYSWVWKVCSLHSVTTGSRYRFHVTGFTKNQINNRDDSNYSNGDNESSQYWGAGGRSVPARCCPHLHAVFSMSRRRRQESHSQSALVKSSTMATTRTQNTLRTISRRKNVLRRQLTCFLAC